MRKRMSAKRKTVIDDAEIIGRESIYEARSGKASTMDQVLGICNRVYEKATNNIRRV